MLVKVVSFWWPHVHGVFSPSIEIALRLLFICPNSKTYVVNVFVCLQDILSSIDPLLPAALVKCLYLLVCLPAKADNVETEQTFQEPLTKVNSPNWTIFFSFFIIAPYVFSSSFCNLLLPLVFAAFVSFSVFFFQVLLQLCRQPVNVERLVETQEMQCLIIGLTSLWDQTSAPWRRQASRVLKAVSAAATSNTVPCLLGDVTVWFVYSQPLCAMNWLSKQGRKGCGETRRLDFFPKHYRYKQVFCPLNGFTSQRRHIVIHMMTPSAQIIQFNQMFQ